MVHTEYAPTRFNYVKHASCDLTIRSTVWDRIIQKQTRSEIAPTTVIGYLRKGILWKNRDSNNNNSPFKRQKTFSFTDVYTK
jgi:hypothetical protein